MATPAPDRWFAELCKQLESEIGRGWKRELARKVGVGESNVQVWLKSGRVPAAVRRAIELSDEVASMRQELGELERLANSRWICEEFIGGVPTFSVHEMNHETGRARLIARGIPELKDAHAIAGIPQAENILADVFGRIQFSNDEEDIELCRRIKAWSRSSAWEEKAEIARQLGDFWNETEETST